MPETSRTKTGDIEDGFGDDIRDSLGPHGGSTLSGRWQGLWEMWETAAILPSFSKSCGKARLHRGFPWDGSFHSPIHRNLAGV